EEAGLKKAIALRDTLGRELWGKHWRRVLNEPELFTRLPHSLEPALVHKPTPTGADPYKRTSYYLAKWMEYDVNGERVLKSKLASIEKLGKLAAYNQAKRILMQAYKDDIEILSYMGRFNIVRVM
ncbi:hypothetical protein, partial [Amphritea sp.]|uniref:hypothetical protein n=1 Tax=Amphritea sp. TaxID=1872502 RepID=UPI003A91D627